MTSLRAARPSRSLGDTRLPARPSLGASEAATIIDRRLQAIRALAADPIANLSNFRPAKQAFDSSSERLRARLAVFKTMTATIAMHLDSNWRKSLFSTLEALLDPDDWDDEFALPSEKSFSTFLRMILYLHPTKRPGIGLAPNGRIVASWRRGRGRVVIECLDNDEVRWVLSRYVEGERESGAGQVQLHRVPDVTAAYNPEPLFTNGDKIV